MGGTGPVWMKRRGVILLKPFLWVSSSHHWLTHVCNGLRSKMNGYKSSLYYDMDVFSDSRCRVGNSTTSVQCKPPYVWTDMVQGCRSTVWCRRLVLPYGTKGGQFVLQFDLSTAGRGCPDAHQGTAKKG